MKKILGVALLVLLFMLLSVGITCLIVAKNIHEIGTLYEGLIVFGITGVSLFAGGTIGFASLLLLALGWAEEK